MLRAALVAYIVTVGVWLSQVERNPQPNGETAIAIDSAASVANRAVALSAVHRLLGAVLDNTGRVTCFDLLPSGTDLLPGCAPERYSQSLFPPATRQYSGVAITLAEASAIGRGNEAVRDSVIKRECSNEARSSQCGGAVHAAAVALLDDTQHDTEAKLAALRRLIADRTKRVVVLITPGFPVQHEPRALKDLIAEFRAQRVRLILIRLKSPTEFKGLLSDAAQTLASRLEDVNQVDLATDEDIARVARLVAAALLPSETKPSGPTSSTAPGDTLTSVVGALRGYVDSFARDMRFVIAHERYDQEVRSRMGSFGANPGVVRSTRTTDAEVSLAHISDGLWIMARQVVSVDGRPVATRPDPLLAGARTEGEAIEQMIRVANDAARWNIGSVRRNINTPTLAMWLLTQSAQERLRFALAGTARTAAGLCQVLRFAETGKPPLMHVEHEPAPASGRIWVLEGSGAVVKTELVLERNVPSFRGTIPISRATIIVDYVYWPQAKSWVPGTMIERYERPGDREADIVVAKAIYSQYRRFTIDTRIK